jgi:hypothetical protein
VQPCSILAPRKEISAIKFTIHIKEGSMWDVGRAVENRQSEQFAIRVSVSLRDSDKFKGKS